MNLQGTIPKIAAQSLGADERRDLLRAGIFPRYAPSGHLVCLQGSNRMGGTLRFRAANNHLRSRRSYPARLRNRPIQLFLHGIARFCFGFCSGGTVEIHLGDHP